MLSAYMNSFKVGMEIVYDCVTVRVIQRLEEVAFEKKVGFNRAERGF
jgi:hypothetical protein